MRNKDTFQRLAWIKKEASNLFDQAYFNRATKDLKKDTTMKMIILP